MAGTVRAIGVSPFTWDRRRTGFCGLKTDQVKRLKAPGKENDRLRRAVADPTLERLIIRDAASENL